MTTGDRTRERLAAPVAIVVLGVWAASLVIGSITQSYIALEVTTPVMLMLAGYVFGVSIVKGTRHDSE